MNAKSYIYEEDQEAFISAMDKERMRSEIRAHGTFIMQYRLIIGGRPTYVNLKATMITGSDRFMIIGVNNNRREQHRRPSPGARRGPQGKRGA